MRTRLGVLFAVLALMVGTAAAQDARGLGRGVKGRERRRGLGAGATAGVRRARAVRELGECGGHFWAPAFQQRSYPAVTATG